MNLQYESSLRKKYGTYLIWTAGIAIIELIVGALAKDMTMLDFAAVATTVLPAFFWAVREQFKQSDAATANETLKGKAEKVSKKVGSKGCEDFELRKAHAGIPRCDLPATRRKPFDLSARLQAYAHRV